MTPAAGPAGGDRVAGGVVRPPAHPTPAEAPPVTVGEALDAERARQGLSLYALGKAAGLSAAHVRAVLTGATPNPGVLTVLAILGGLGRSLCWLDRQMRAAE